MASEMLTLFSKEETELIHRAFDCLLMGRGFSTDDLVAVEDYDLATSIFRKSYSPEDVPQKKQIGFEVKATQETEE
jgi:hypothetical protein